MDSAILLTFEGLRRVVDPLRRSSSMPGSPGLTLANLIPPHMTVASPAHPDPCGDEAASLLGDRIILVLPGVVVTPSAWVLAARHHRAERFPVTTIPDRCSACQTTAMTRVSKIGLDGALTVVSGRCPPTQDGFRSERVQVLHWQVDEEFHDPAPHYHRDSDEVYVVLDGSIDVVAGGDEIRVGPSEALTVGAGVVHSLVAVQYPARGLTIRGPSIQDKQLAPTPRADLPAEDQDDASAR